MKGGSCKAPFEEWEACVDAARDEHRAREAAEGGASASAAGAAASGPPPDLADRCGALFMALHGCMERDPDYYAPMLPDGDGAEEGGGGAGAGEEGGAAAGAAGAAGEAAGRGEAEGG